MLGVVIYHDIVVVTNHPGIWWWLESTTELCTMVADNHPKTGWLVTTTVVW
jgi:hypothetical protein